MSRRGAGAVAKKIGFVLSISVSLDCGDINVIGHPAGVLIAWPGIYNSAGRTPGQARFCQ
jgi:hypothetical protein